MAPAFHVGARACEQNLTGRLGIGPVGRLASAPNAGRAGKGMEMAMLDAMDGKTRDVATAIAILRQRFGDRLQTGEAIRRQHANTLTWLDNQPPDAVIWVENAEEVGEVVRVARDHRAPIIPFGAGTSLEGHVNAPLGGLSLDFSRMNQILAVNERDLDCVVQPGVSRKQLNDHLRDLGPVLPGRSRRRGSHHRRHGLDARLRHHRRALRHHARERAQHHGRDGGRLDRQDGAAGAEVLGRLRPDAPAGRR